MAVTASRAQIDAAWRPLTAAVAGQDGGAVLAAIPAAVGVGLLHECGGAVLIPLEQDNTAAEPTARELIVLLRTRDWDGDQLLADLLSSATDADPTGRTALKIDLDALADVRSDEGGGWLDLARGLPWPQQLFDDGDPELIGDPDSDPDGWLWVDPEGSRPGWQDMADFATMIEDAAACTDLTRAIEGRGAFRRFQQALDRHDQYRAAWRVHTSERRTGRARAWLADAGYDALP